MKPEFLLSKAHTLWSQRNFFSMAFGLAMASNIVLSLCVMNKNERIVMVPMNALDHPLVLENGEFSDAYLIDWANTLLREVLTVNPQTVDYQNKKFLEFSLSPTFLNEKLTQNAKDIKRDQMATVFYPKDFQIDRKLKVITVTGTFMAYLGQDRNPVVTSKTYHLGYTLLSNGVIAIKTLEEKSDA